MSTVTEGVKPPLRLTYNYIPPVHASTPGTLGRDPHERSGLYTGSWYTLVFEIPKFISGIAVGHPRSQASERPSWKGHHWQKVDFGRF